MSDPIRRQQRMRCSVARAFAAFTAQIDAWWPRSHRRFEQSTLHLEGSVGGRLLERSATGEEAVLGRIVEYEPPHRLGYLWYPGSPSAPTEVTVRFSEADGFALVEIEHGPGTSGAAAEWPTRSPLFIKGWNAVLPALAAFAEQADE